MEQHNQPKRASTYSLPNKAAINHAVLRTGHKLSGSLPIWLGLAAFLFFLATRSIQHDRNTIYRVLEIESGSLMLMAAPRHVLFDPVAAGFYSLWKMFGYQGSSLFPAQVLVAMFAAIGVALMTSLLTRYCKGKLLTVLLAIGFLGSYSYWRHSTDVEYWIPFITCVLAVVVFFFRWFYDKQTGSIVWITLLTYVMILFWSAGIIFGATVALALLLLPSSHSLKTRGVAVVVFVVTNAFLLVVTYLWLGLHVNSLSGFQELVPWMTTYPGKMPIWGVADPRRVLNSAWSLAAAVLPFWDGLGLRGLIRGQFDATKLIPQAALVATSVVLVIIAFYGVRRRPALESRSAVGFLSVWIISYVLFLTWFDPFEPKWWVIVLIPIWLLLGDLTRAWTHQVGRTGYWVLACWVTLLVLANWSGSMAPRATDVGDDYRRAAYTAEQMSEADVLVMPFTEEWVLHVGYFGRRRILDLGGLALYHGSVYAQQQLKELVCSANDGEVFLGDYTHLTDEEWKFITLNTGISAAFFDEYEREEAWSWNEEPVWRLSASCP